MTPTLPAEVVKTMASREHRLHHWLWHEVRNRWLTYPEEVREQIRERGWEPPRPALDERGRPILNNDAGEDFLYMHRRMLVDVSRVLARVSDPNYPRVQVWTSLPPPDDNEFPVPPAWFDPTWETEAERRSSFDNLQRFKSDLFYRKRLLFWQKLFKDPSFLRGLSLGELGALLEGTIHAGMHLRWASAPAGVRPDPGPNEGHTIDPLWDDPRYDFLGDTYSSHVNPVFWSLHGWVDDRIEDWKTANGVYGNDFWKGTWVGKWPGEHSFDRDTPAPKAGGMTSPHERPVEDARVAPAVGGEPDHRHTSEEREELEELVTVIGRCGIFYSGYERAISETYV